MNDSLINRRRVLRGMLQGTAVGIGLPLLDLFLNDNGNALADGAPLPVCFGTWYWGLGLPPGHWEPDKAGNDYQLSPVLDELQPIKEKINIYSGTQVLLDGNASQAHFSGQQCAMTGRVSDQTGGYGRSLDEVVAEKLAVRTRFPSLTVSCDGNPAMSYSARGANAMNTAEISPLNLYQQIFSDGFQYPNADNFVPDPEVMLRKSALSMVTSQRQKLERQVGARDRARLDEYFTSLRSLEQRLALELEKPAPLPSCQLPGNPSVDSSSTEIETALHTHQLFSELIGHALACGQTRIFNMTMSHDMMRAGDPTTAHIYTHEEKLDPELGYQKSAYWFARRYMTALKAVVTTLDNIREGDGTLLDRTLIFAYTDHGNSSIHDYKWMPFFTAGGAGGGIKNGWHLRAENAPCNKVGLTCLKALGLPVDSWGTGSNTVIEPFGEVLS